MSVLFMTGDHPRHRFIANTLYQRGLLSGLVVERRESFNPQPPDALADDLKRLFVRHFRERDEAEERHFSDAGGFPADLPTLYVERSELNGDAVRAFLANTAGRLLLSYGVHILDAQTLRASQAAYRWNIHGGLSPWYRGCITHFWPSYMLEPQMTGFTIHELTDVLDHGPVIHQTGTELFRGDGLHDLACRAVNVLARELPALITHSAANGIAGVAHKTSGRLWLARDWRPEHLRQIYQCFDNRIVDQCLDGNIVGREPELIRLW